MKVAHRSLSTQTLPIVPADGQVSISQELHGDLPREGRGQGDGALHLPAERVPNSDGVSEMPRRDFAEESHRSSFEFFRSVGLVDQARCTNTICCSGTATGGTDLERVRS